MNNSTSKSSILPLESAGKSDRLSVKELASELRKRQEELQSEIEKHAEELKSIQTSLTEQIHNLSDSNKDELKKIHELFVKLGSELDKFKNHVRELISEKFTDETERLNRLHQQQSERIEQLEDILISVEKKADDTRYDQIRSELIEGLKMLGQRVGEAIEKIENRFEKLKQELPQKTAEQETSDLTEEQDGMEETRTEFGDVKESSLLQAGEEFEVVPKNSISDLGEMFRKHAENMKFYLQEHEEKLLSVDHLLKVYEEECSAEIAILKRKSKLYFYISLGGIVVVAALSLILHFITF